MLETIGFGICFVKVIMLNNYLIEPIFMRRRKRPMAALEVPTCRRYGRKQVRSTFGKPKRLKRQAGLPARAHDLQNLSRFGLARG
jgi:hypothetical protein